METEEGGGHTPDGQRSSEVITGSGFSLRYFQEVSRSDNWALTQHDGEITVGIPVGKEGTVTLVGRDDVPFTVTVPLGGSYVQFGGTIEFDYRHQPSMSDHLGGEAVDGGSVAVDTPCKHQANLTGWNYIGDCWAPSIRDPATGCMHKKCTAAGEECKFSWTDTSGTETFEAECSATPPADISRCDGEMCVNNMTKK